MKHAQTVADVLVDPEGKDQPRTFWEQSAHALLTAVILHVVYAGDDKTLARLLSDPARPLPETLEALLATRHDPGLDRGWIDPHRGRATYTHPVVAAAARSLLDMDPRTSSGSWRRRRRTCRCSVTGAGGEHGAVRLPAAGSRGGRGVGVAVPDAGAGGPRPAARADPAGAEPAVPGADRAERPKTWHHLRCVQPARADKQECEANLAQPCQVPNSRGAPLVSGEYAKEHYLRVLCRLAGGLLVGSAEV